MIGLRRGGNRKTPEQEVWRWVACEKGTEKFVTMKKFFIATAFIASLFFAAQVAQATIYCSDFGDCIVCWDTEAAYHPEGGCVTGQGCIARSETCGHTSGS